MNNEEYKKLEQQIDILNKEFLIGGYKAKLYKNGEEFIQAMRRNEIPEIPWTELDEQKYQLEEQLNKDGEAQNK